MGITWFIVAWLRDKQRMKILKSVIYGKIQIHLKNSTYYMWKEFIFLSVLLASVSLRFFTKNKH